MLLARAAGWHGMAAGQALDLAAGGQAMDAGAVATMQALKTGALFRFACEAGAVLGGAPAKDRAALLAYGTAFGQAFQLADDLLDAEGDAELAGKAVDKDVSQGKATLVGLLGPEAAKARLAALVDKAGQALDAFGDRAETLREATRFIAERRS